MRGRSVIRDKPHEARNGGIVIMAYKILKSLLSNGKKTAEEILDMADVYYAAGRLNQEQYEDIVASCNREEVDE